MRTRNGIVAAAAILWCGLCHAEAAGIGHALSSDFLSKLMLARASRSEIAVIHEQVGSAMLIDPESTHKTVMYLRGHTFLWAQINGQLSAASDQDKPIHLEIARWTMDTQSCDKLNRKLAAFLAQVKEVLSDPRASNVDSKEVTLDAANVRIQMAARDSWLTIIPDGSTNPPLQQAALELHSVVSGCANFLQPSIEQHAF